MHELAVTQSILDVALEAAQNAGAQRIIAIDLLIGNLSSIVDDSVQFYFEILTKGTMAEGAVLRFHREVAMATCLACGRTFATAGLPLLADCPSCGSAHLNVVGGRSFSVVSIEVEQS